MSGRPLRFARVHFIHFLQCDDGFLLGFERLSLFWLRRWAWWKVPAEAMAVAAGSAERVFVNLLTFHSDLHGSASADQAPQFGNSQQILRNKKLQN